MFHCDVEAAVIQLVTDWAIEWLVGGGVESLKVGGGVGWVEPADGTLEEFKAGWYGERQGVGRRNLWTGRELVSNENVDVLVICVDSDKFSFDLR